MSTVEAFPDVTDQLPDRFRRVILRVEAGSTVHGINLPDGDDDRDELAVSVDPPEYVTGITRGKDSYMYRTAAEGVRSGPGDLDLTVHSLRKFARLAVGGNPTILQTFFVPRERRQVDRLGAELLDRWRELFLARSCAVKFAGYLRAQRLKAEGSPDARYSRGAREGSRDPARMGKYLAHMLRLGHQGVELLTTGRMRLPMADRPRAYILATRRGDIPPAEALDEARRCERILTQFADGERSTKLPDEPNYAGVNSLLHMFHKDAWE